jgi:hypothetical protein
MNIPASPPPCADPLHAGFLQIVPRVALHGRITFRHLRSEEAREEAVAEMLALCWLWFLRLTRRGEDPTRFPSALATFAARAVRSGRRLTGQEPGGDVLSPLAQRRHDFVVTRLPAVSAQLGTELEEALRDNTVSAVPDQVSFRIDFPAWRASRTERDRRLIDDLMLGERTADAARRHGVSAARISQLRVAFHDDWLRFCADRGGEARPATAKA